MLKLIIRHRLLYPLLLTFYIFLLNYKFFIMGHIPFPGDLLVNSYSPWFDYYKFPVQNPLISDIFSQFFLWKYLAIDSYKNLQWPLWNPYSFTGTPLLATYHSAVLYPLNILLLAPKYFGWGLYISSQTFIAALSMYLLLSLWIEKKIARFAGAIIFSLGGLMTTWWEFGTAVHAMAWLPLSLFAIEKFIKTYTFRYLVLLISVLVLIIFAGNVQVTTYTFSVVVLFSIFKLWRHSLIKTQKAILIFIAIIAAVAFSTPQLLPTLELMNNSMRNTDSYIQNYNFGLLSFKDIYKFFIADYYGNPVTRNYWGFLNYSETSSFLGTITLVLIIYSLLYLKKDSNCYFFLAILIFSLLFAFGNPLSYLIYKTGVPFLTLSFASRILFLTTFSASIVSAYSLNQIANSTAQDRRTFKSLIWSTAVILGIVIGTFIAQSIIQMILNSSSADVYTKIYPEDTEYALRNYSTALRNSIVPLSMLSLATISLLLLKNFSKIHRSSPTLYTTIIKKSRLLLTNHNRPMLLFSIFLVIMLCLDLGRYFLKFNPFTSQELVYPITPSLKFLQEQPGIFRMGREHAEVFPPNTWTAYKLQSIEGYDPLYLNSYSKFMHFLNGGDLRSGATGRYVELSAKYQSPYIDITNTKYFMGVSRDKNGYIGGDNVNLSFLQASYPVVFRDRNSVVVSNPNALERIYFSPSFIVKPPLEAEKMIMTSPDFDPRKVTIISDDIGLSQITGNGEAKFIEYTPNHIIIETQTAAEELLILADQFEKGWKARIDNTPVKISQANLIFRAVKIPPGKHRVVFYYSPESFLLGIKIFVSTFSILVIAAFILKKTAKIIQVK